ncbi:MAG: osmoprotectant transport system permease protein [Microbacteriaceae bacterium]|jgi:osmoprotectant transport system permease protein|nr:osmoprotectant transport system permease protein [Microbacteriaceae bacterium]
MNWIANNLDQIGQLTLAHLAIALPPIVLSFVIAVPIGWLANRLRWSRGILRWGSGALLTLSGMLYAIPSAPLFFALPSIIGTGLRDPINLVVGLTLYGVALMVRTSADGLAAVDPDVRESATAVGFSDWSRFWRVELPLAAPVLLAGLRVVAVSTVSLTTVGAVLGISSLGILFTDGFQRNIPAEIATGIVVTMAIALVIDALLVQLGRLLMPWVRATSRVGATRESRRVKQAVVT